MTDSYLISVYSANSSEIGKDEDVKLLWKEDLESYLSDLDPDLTIESFLKEIKTTLMGNPELYSDLVMELFFGADNNAEDCFDIYGSSISYLIGTIEKISSDGSTTLIYKFRNIPSDLVVEAKDNDEWETWEDLFLNHRTNFKFELIDGTLILSAQDATLRDLLSVGHGTFKSFDWICPDEDDPLEEYLIRFINCFIR